MRQHGFSEMAAAQTIGVSQGIVNRWLRPADDPLLAQPSVDSLERIAPKLGVELVRLKEMTGRLSPADLAILNKVDPTPRDPRFESFVKDLWERWRMYDDEDERQHAEDVARVGFRMHGHSRTRKPRSEKSSPNKGDSVWPRQIATALA